MALGLRSLHSIRPSTRHVPEGRLPSCWPICTLEGLGPCKTGRTSPCCLMMGPCFTCSLSGGFEELCKGGEVVPGHKKVSRTS